MFVSYRNHLWLSATFDFLQPFLLNFFEFLINYPKFLINFLSGFPPKLTVISVVSEKGVIRPVPLATATTNSKLALPLKQSYTRQTRCVIVCGGELREAPLLFLCLSLRTDLRHVSLFCVVHGMRCFHIGFHPKNGVNNNSPCFKSLIKRSLFVLILHGDYVFFDYAQLAIGG